MRLPGLLALVASAGLSSGCGVVAFSHDQLLGPASPAGEIHELTVGADFRVTETGVRAERGDQALWRPYPVDMLQRMGTPHSLYTLVQGLQAFVAGFSPLVQRQVRYGRALSPEAQAGIRPGLALGEVLARLGPPQQWILRERGALLRYRAERRDQSSFYLGLPPLAASFIPVPGVASARFRYTDDDSEADELLLFFDRDDVLTDVIGSAAP